MSFWSVTLVDAGVRVKLRDRADRMARSDQTDALLDQIGVTLTLASHREDHQGVKAG